jgi:hypothetical protein
MVFEENGYGHSAKIRSSREVLMLKPVNGAPRLIAWDPGEEKIASGHLANHQHLDIWPCPGLETFA